MLPHSIEEQQRIAEKPAAREYSSLLNTGSKLWEMKFPII